MKTMFDLIRETLSKLDNEQFVKVYNRYCELKGYFDNKIVENNRKNLRKFIEANCDIDSYQSTDKYLYRYIGRNLIRSTDYPYLVPFSFYTEFIRHINNYYENYEDILPL
jgi:hypothetical protein